MIFDNEADYDTIGQFDELVIENAPNQISHGNVITVKNVTKSLEYKMNIDLYDRQKEIMLAGGLINYTKENSK